MTNTSKFHQMQPDIGALYFFMLKKWILQVAHKKETEKLKNPLRCYHLYAKKQDLKEKNLGFLEILDSCDSILEVSKPGIMRFHCFVMEKIVMDPEKCSVFGILRNTSKSQVVEHFLDCLYEVTEDSLDETKQLAKMIRKLEKQYGTNTICASSIEEVNGEWWEISEEDVLEIVQIILGWDVVKQLRKDV